MKNTIEHEISKNKPDHPKSGGILLQIYRAIFGMLEALDLESIGSMAELNKKQAEVQEKLLHKDRQLLEKRCDREIKGGQLAETREYPRFPPIHNVLWSAFCLLAIVLLAGLCVTNAAGWVKDNFFMADDWFRPIVFAAPFAFIPFLLKWIYTRDWVNKALTDKVIYFCGVLAAGVFAFTYADRFAFIESGFGVGGFQEGSTVEYMRTLFLSQVVLEIILSTVFSLQLIKALEPKKNWKWLKLSDEFKVLDQEIKTLEDEVAELRGADAEIDYFRFLTAEYEDSFEAILHALLARKSNNS